MSQTGFIHHVADDADDMMMTVMMIMKWQEESSLEAKRQFVEDR